MGLIFREFKRFVVVEKYNANGDDSSTVFIPDHYNGKPVTGIMSKAFSNQAILKVVIPNTLQIVGEGAFENCKDLKSVSPNENSFHTTLPESLVLVEERAFANSGVTGILSILNKSEVVIKESAFENCASLAGCLINSSIIKLGKRAFYGCTSMEFVIGSSKTYSIPEQCFANCPSMKQMTLPFRAVARQAFEGNEKLITLKPAAILDHIGKDAFSGTALSQLPKCKKGCDSMNIEEEKKEDLPVDFNSNTYAICRELNVNYLFKLRLNYSEDPGSTFPFRIKGVFHVPGQFHTILPAKLAAVEFFLEGHEKLADLISYVSAQSWHVYLYGQRVGDNFEVYDLEMAKKAVEPPISIDLLHEIVRRCITSTEQSKKGEEKHPYYMRTKDEFFLFMKTAGSSCLPLWVQEAAKKEMFVLENPSSKHDPRVEHAQLALECLLNIDWNPTLTQTIDLDKAREDFNRNFYGLEPIKQAFLEITAELSRTKRLPQCNILLVGEPGVGKTYISKFFAQQILNMPTVNLDFSTLGPGEDEISGSSRIYSNSQPGLILKSFLTNRSSAAVLFVNELDKATAGQEKALLSILDGTGMSEGFLECQLPSDNILCIASCNEIEKLSAPLRSRFRIVHVDGFSAKEKTEIWRHFALPKALKDSALPPDAVCLRPEAETVVICEYSTEAGVRELYTIAGQLAKKCCYDLTFQPDLGPQAYTVNDIRNILGPSKYITRPLMVYPGSVRFVYPVNGHLQQGLVEVTVEKGSGHLEILGATTPLIKQYIRAAWKAVGNTSRFNLHNSDITVFIPKAIQSSENIVGMPVYVAICLALLQTSANLSKICTIGSGVDLFGNIYLDSGLPGKALINLVEEEHIQVLYGPPGFAARLDLAQLKNPPLIVESLDGESLIRMIIANSQQLLEK